ncbi:protein POOR HOMOLOGOUS SYNAPSIS 1-like [Henckelia pumila]|uniref:protein POOR HOMOLOGOUS SYNAPSIS 1-like n=1 Tax=Henckelia pumila TaxID=405737 RepID=UPI003C6E1CCB
MAESQVTTPSSVLDQWKIYYARFINYSSTVVNRAHPSLTRLSAAWKNRHQGGTWITALSANGKEIVCVNSVLLLCYLVVICNKRLYFLLKLFTEKATELHNKKSYLKQVAGTSILLIVFRGFCDNFRITFTSKIQVYASPQIQKFAMHFFTVFETEKFMDVLKEISENGSPPLLEYPGLNSKISSQAEVLPFDGPTCRSDRDWQCVASAETSSQLMLPVLESNAVQEQFVREAIEIREAAETIASFPPSFTQLLNNCNPAVDEVNYLCAAKPIKHVEDLKTQFMRYLEGTLLQDMILEKQSFSFDFFGHYGNEQKITETKCQIDQNLMELCLTTEKTWLPLTNGLVLSSKHDRDNCNS